VNNTDKSALLMQEVLIAAFIQRTTSEKQVKVPLMLDVSEEWISIVKEASVYLNLEFGILLEALLLDIFGKGLLAYVDILLKKYKSPLDIINAIRDMR